MQTRRLLLAKQLLTDTCLPVTAVAMASGFKSLRRFNVALKERYRMTPTELRKLQNNTVQDKSATFRLAYRPPFDWEQILSFLSHRAIPGVEAVQDGAYYRTIHVSRQKKEFRGFIEVRDHAEERMISVRLSHDLVPVCGVILERVKRIFDLQADPIAINAVLGLLAHARPGLRVPGSFDGFEMAVRAILGQQISVAGASTLAGRFAAKFGTPISGPLSSLKYLFPSASRIATATGAEIASLGIIRRRAQTIIALAQAIHGGELILEPGHRLQGTLRRLGQIPGIGDWTAQYIAMRGLSWPDAFPHTDLGIAKALKEKNSKKILEITEKWRPWRAYAALHLWSTLEKTL
jgi:AraC family transcriptional regulator of adaptative response / DNA-3-methyladenine glycosylase II